MEAELKRALTTHFKLFSEQIGTLHQLLETHQAKFNEDPLAVKRKQVAMLPLLEKNQFETSLLGMLSKHKGLRKECGKAALDLFSAIDVRADLSTVHRECMALACAVVRNTDNISGEFVSFCTRGGDDLLCKWIQLAFNHKDFSLVDHIMLCFDDRQIEVLAKQKLFNTLQRLADVLEICARKAIKDSSATTTEAAMSAALTGVTPTSTACLGYWLCNQDTPMEKRTTMKRVTALKAKCAALLKGAPLSQVLRPKELKRPRVVESAPKPILSSQTLKQSTAGVKPLGVARPTPRSSLSIRSILTGEMPSKPPSIPSAIRMERSSPSSAIGVGHSPLPDIQPSPRANTSEGVAEFVSFSLLANESARGIKRKRIGKTVRWADCRVEDGREPGPLCEVRLFTPLEDEHKREDEHPVSFEGGDDEDAPVSGLAHRDDLSTDRLHLEQRRHMTIIASQPWHTPAILDHELRRGTLESKEYRVQTLRLSKQDMARNSFAMSKKSTSVPLDPEEPPKESIEEKRRAQTRGSVLVIPWEDMDPDPHPAVPMDVTPTDVSEANELLSILPPYVRELGNAQLELLLELLCQEQYLHLLEDPYGFEFRELVDRIRNGE